VSEKFTDRLSRFLPTVHNTLIFLCNMPIREWGMDIASCVAVYRDFGQNEEKAVAVGRWFLFQMTIASCARRVRYPSHGLRTTPQRPRQGGLSGKIDFGFGTARAVASCSE